jgi:hypothetical protein
MNNLPYDRRLGVILSLGLICSTIQCGGGGSPAATTTTTSAVSVSVSPSSPQSVNLSQSAQFAATVSNTTNTAVTWSMVGAGAISASGLYTAPNDLPSNTTTTITATSQADTSKSASVILTITSNEAVGTPTATSLTSSPGGQIQFAVVVSGTSNDTSVTWSVNSIPGGNSTVGTISSTGLYTAPSAVPNPNMVTVTANSAADPSKSAGVQVTVRQLLAVSSFSTTSPTPLTPIYISTVGINPSAPLVIQFSDGSGFSLSEQPIRVTSDGTVVAAVPLYIPSGSAQPTSGSVTVILTQSGQSTAAAGLTIQNLPSVVSYGTQLGDISEAFLDFQEMEIGRRINELQAYQALPGNTVDTSQAQAALQTSLTGFIEARSDVDQVYATNSVVISAATLPDGTAVQFDQTSLDMMDRVIGVYLNEIAPIVLSPPPGSAARASRKLARIVSPFRPTGRRQSGSSALRRNPSLTPLQSSRWTGRTAHSKGHRPSSAADPSNVQNVINFLKAAGNLTGLGSTYASYQEANSTPDGPSLLDYGLAAGGGIAGLLGIADTAGISLVPKAVNPALGGLLASVSLLQHLGNELGDLAFIMVASGNGGDPSVLADAQADLNKNARESITDTVTVELSLLDPESPLASFGPDLVSYFNTNAGMVVLQSATILTNVAATALAIYDTNFDDPVTDAALGVAAETTSVFGSDSQGFAEGVGTVDVTYSGGPVAPLSGIELSSDLTDIFTAVADTVGNYDFFFPLQDPNFDYANTIVTIVDPLSQDVLGSEVVDLTGVNTSAPVQIPTMQGSCIDTDAGDPDGDDPDCD